MSTNHLTGPSMWLRMEDIIELTDAVTYARALLIYRNQQILDLSLESEGPQHLLMGHVQGTQRRPYLTQVDLTRSDEGRLLGWDSNCTCPVGGACKHAVALLIKAAYQAHKLPTVGTQTGGHRANPLPDARALAHQQALRTLQQWLGDYQRATPHAPTPDIAQDSRNSDERRATLRFVLRNALTSGHKPVAELVVVETRPKVGGGWVRAKAVRSPCGPGNQLFDQAPADVQEAMLLLRGMPTIMGGSGMAYYGRMGVVPEGKMGLALLEKLAASGCLHTESAVYDDHPDAVLHWSEPRQLDWDWKSNPVGDQMIWSLKPRVTPGPVTLCLNQPPIYIDLATQQCGPLDLNGLSVGQAWVLMRAPALDGDTLKEVAPEMMRALGASVVPPPPSALALPEVNGVKPVARLHIGPQELGHVGDRGLLRATLRFDYQGLVGWWTGQGPRVLVQGPLGQTLLTRDPQAELMAVLALQELGLDTRGGGIFELDPLRDPHRWMVWAEADFAPLRGAGFHVTVDAALDGWVSQAGPIVVHLDGDAEEGDTSPWFDLSLGIEVDGQRQNVLPWLPRLIAVLADSPTDPATGEHVLPEQVYVPRPGGGFLKVPTLGLQPWLRTLLELVGEREPHDLAADTLRLSRLDALRAVASLGEGAVWDGAQRLQALVDRLRQQPAADTWTPPPGLQAELRPYQQQGVSWLQFLREAELAGILADDMGLGKTVQALTHILTEKHANRLDRPVLIVAPVSLMGNWLREAQRFSPDLRCMVWHGAERHARADELSTHDVVIAPYSLMQRDRERWQKQAWHMVVLDEAQNIKNASTHAAQVLMGLDARHRLCLSGTPMENHLGELWSLFHFLMPGFLGSQKRFTELFRGPIEKQGDTRAMQTLRARISPFMLRRTKSAVASELPPKVESIVSVELEGKQADLYETIRLGMERTVREALNTRGLARSQVTILDALLKLRQVCCDPRLVKLQAARKVPNSAKLEQLMSMLPEMLAEGRRILLFSQFTSMLSLIETELERAKINWVKLTGQSQHRDALIDRFTSGEVPLFLISLKAGGVGLNLPQADTVIHYDPWWNPAVEAQATDRAHRIGQTQSVWVVKLVAQGTIEERILGLQERKAQLSAALTQDSATRNGPIFSENDLTELLKPLGT